MARYNLERQVVLVMPILVGLDGQDKMSKSKGNYIAITDAPNEMFGKIMSIPDNLMPNYYQLLTDLPGDRIKSLLDPQTTHPREAKDVLAQVIVESFHPEPDAAHRASAEFRRRFAEHQLPSDIETRTVAQSPLGVVELLHTLGFAASNSEARRLIEGGAVSINDQKISDPKAMVTVAGDQIVRVGKRRVCKITKA
jgi:tyrosyl-tRNA synthetase